MGDTTHGQAASASADPMRRIRVRFVGEVQGVGFRWTARRVAQDLDLTGWVRNESDGSVSMELQGPSSRIAAWFTLFDRSYARYPIRYVIDDKDDIDLVRGEGIFHVRF